MCFSSTDLRSTSIEFTEEHEYYIIIYSTSSTELELSAIQFTEKCKFYINIYFTLCYWSSRNRIRKTKVKFTEERPEGQQLGLMRAAKGRRPHPEKREKKSEKNEN